MVSNIARRRGSPAGWQAAGALSTYLLIGGFCPDGAAPQSVAGLIDDCIALIAIDDSRCADAAVVALEAVDQVALLAGNGAEIPGSASTLGMRIGRSSRIAAWLRTGASKSAIPDILGTDPQAEASFVVPSLRIGVAGGIHDGLRIAPTLWGLFSLDLVGEAGVMRFPSNRGYAIWLPSYTLGARVGLLRESFTVPGITLSVRRHFNGSVRLGDESDPSQVSSRPGITSLRASMGKDLVAVGLVLGTGLDLYSSEVEMRIDDARVTGSLSGSRRLYYGGLSMNFLFVQVSGEAGLAEGLDAVEGSIESWAPDAWSGFGALAIRLTI